MTRCKPREGGNHESVVTMTGWKPRKFRNHDKVQTMGGWKWQKCGNHDRVQTMGGWKPHMQTTRCANHGRVETTWVVTTGGWKPHMQTTGVVTTGRWKQNINIFLESKLSQHDKFIDYQINNCIIIRADEKNTINPHCGIISYINSSLKINSIQNMSTEIIDTLYMNISHNKKSKDCMQSCFLIFVYFKCCSDFLLYFYKCSTSMAFT